jgi:RNA methyltransferase, TrmH family
VEIISSLQNPKIKNLVKLQKASERNDQNVFIVEGLKEINLALEAGYKPQMAFWCANMGLTEKDFLHTLKQCPNFYSISKDAFEKVAYREGSDGIIVVFEQQKHSLKSIKLSANPLVIILESVEKPGNLGAILRTADASKVDAVIVCDPKTDLYNPNVVRSSIGCLFTNQVAACTNAEALKWLKENKIKSYAAALVDEAKSYYGFNYKTSTALIMGTEADGLSKFWLENADEKIIIPMQGKIDSLNVSVSTAVLAFEVARQREFK